MTTQSGNAGRPKRYAEKVTISHSLELDTLNKLNKLADFDNTRTEIINRAINAYLKTK